MIKVKIETREHLPRNVATCSKCGHEEVFYNYPPWQCEKCSFTFGRINRLMEDIRVRKYYARNGAID